VRDPLSWPWSASTVLRSTSVLSRLVSEHDPPARSGLLASTISSSLIWSFW
jgi:hypothetical protein